MSRGVLTRLAQGCAVVAAAIAVLALATDWGSWERSLVPAAILLLAGVGLLTARAWQASERRASEASHRLTARGQQARRILDRSHEAYISMDREGRVIEWNSTAETMFGWRRDEALGAPVSELIVPPDMRDAHLEGLERFLETGQGPVVGPRTEVAARHRDGSEIPVEISIAAIEEGGTYVFHGFVRDITERKLLQSHQAEQLARAEETARVDPLTGLPNRRAWEEELGRELARARRTRQALCVALIDVDRFKRFNDSNGHQAGDRLLRRAASAWRLAVRASDVVARYGGEEFAVLLPDCPIDEAMAVVERMREVTPDAQTVSAGIAQWNGYESSEALVDRTDFALYKAKRTGRDRAVTAA